MFSKLPITIKNSIGRNLHQIKNHPIEKIKNRIWKSLGSGWDNIDSFEPVVDVKYNFDALLIPKEHPSRSKHDTFYISDEKVLRTHTSAHQIPLMNSGNKQFTVTGDVYRKDTIDKYHYPVFHQMEGVKLCDTPEQAQKELKDTLTAIINEFFPNCEWRFIDGYFPFTSPSWEVEVLYNGDWVEVLGCGVIHPNIMKNQNIEGSGFAFGLGLERLAMILYKIPDIRYFWTLDSRFISQFNVENPIFEPYSNQPPCYKDISMWVSDSFQSNEFYSLCRDIAGDLIESIDLIDSFEKNNKRSECYRMNFRSNDRSLTNDEVNILNHEIRKQVVDLFKVELR